MIPILYENTEQNFSSNGLGRLRDCISCIVTEERNGVYECDFDYPITGSSFNEILYGRIIAVTHDDTGDVQPFDIVSASRPINGIVSFHAVHISYRLSKTIVYGTGINTLTAALAKLSDAVPRYPFIFRADRNANGYVGAYDGVPRSVKSVLGGTEGSILDVFGGEYLFDCWTVSNLRNRGQVRSLTIRYGLNMLDYSDSTDFSESYNSVVPYWTGTVNNAETIIRGALTVGAGGTYNGQTMAAALDLSNRFESTPSASDLQNMAASILQETSPNLPAQSIAVDFVSLRNTPEYAEYESLLTCGLCDTVRVVFPAYGVDGQMKIVKTAYNVLLDRFDSLELGTLSMTLSQALGLTSKRS